MLFDWHRATRSAHYWARMLTGFGHQVRLIAPQFVKPYLKSQKNDANDAEAICEAVSRPNMRFVPAKTVEQQDMQALHRMRSRLIGCHTQLGNQIRGLSEWIADKQYRLGTAKACVAVANKNARVLWAVLAHEEPYRRAV